MTLLALYRGDRETRAAALVCVGATILTLIMVTATYSRIEIPVAVIDVAVLAAFTAIALRSRRFWPLWIAGLQLTTTLAHLLKMLSPNLLNVAYAAAMKFWSYPILLIIAIAVLRTPVVKRLDREQLAG